MTPAPGGEDQLLALIGATGLSLSTQDLAETTGSGIEDPFVFEPERAIEELASALTRVHTTSSADVEYSVTPADLVASAVKQLDLPSGERRELGSSYSHMSREDLLSVLSERAALVEERSTGPVLNQGLPMLANLRFRGVELAGFADWSGAVVADPHLDLAVACRVLLQSFGAAPVRAFLEAYSAAPVDPVRLDWFMLAIELGP